MAVAWIGNREARLEEAVAEAAKLLSASQCPVISMDTDVHGARAAIALADRIGAAVDLADGAATMREAAQLAERGMMTIAPGETRRRADVLVLVGGLPKAQAEFLRELIGSTPDLNGGKPRKVFAVGGRFKGESITALGAGDIAATLAGLRAQIAGRPVSKPVKGFDAFAEAVRDAKFPVFVWSGSSGDALALDMLQGLVSDLNAKKRASTLHLPASENGWATVLASGWSTGFAPRIGFGRGLPENDPWRFDVARMVADGEADCVVAVGASAHAIPPPLTPPLKGEGDSETVDLSDRRASTSTPPSPLRGGVRGGGILASILNLIALAPTAKPIPNAAVTIAIGAPGIDHDAITLRAKLGALGSITATKPTDAPSAALVLRQIIALLDAGEAAA